MNEKELLSLSREERAKILEQKRDSLPENALEAYDQVVDEEFRETAARASQMGISCSSCGIDMSTTAGKVKIISSLKSYMGD